MLIDVSQSGMPAERLIHLLSAAGEPMSLELYRNDCHLTLPSLVLYVTANPAGDIAPVKANSHVSAQSSTCERENSLGSDSLKLKPICAR